jgi:hypothetical protein
MKKEQVPKSQSMLNKLDKFHSLFFIKDRTEDLEPLSNREAIKRFFDGVQYLAFTCAIGYGSFRLFQVPQTLSHPTGKLIITVAAYSSLVLSVFLSYLTLVYSIDLTCENDFIKKARYPFFWILALIFPVMLVLLILVLALFVDRIFA